MPSKRAFDTIYVRMGVRTVEPVVTIPERRRTRPGLVTVLLAIFLGLLVGVGAFAIFLREATYGIWDRVATRVSGRALVFNVSQPTVVDRIQRLERLETVTYTMDKVVEGDRTSAILPDFLIGDSYYCRTWAGDCRCRSKPAQIVGRDGKWQDGACASAGGADLCCRTR